MRDEIMSDSSLKSFPFILKKNSNFYSNFKKQFHEIIDRKLKKNLSP
jgi:hypothetical protein